MEKKTSSKHLQEKYTLLKPLGNGATGQVYLIESSSSKCKYALKKIQLNPSDPYYSQTVQAYKSEIAALQKINNPHVIKIKEYFTSSKPFHCVNIVTEYVDGHDLEEEIQLHKKANKPIPHIQLIDWIIHICLALDQIHSSHIIHRDIKPSNIFLTKDKIAKIGDFGIAKCLDYTHEKGFTLNKGTPYYISPESCSDEEGYTSKVDMWSFGVTLYEMITFNKPFFSKGIPQLIMKIMSGKYKELPMNVPYDLRKLVERLIKVNPIERYSAKEILKLDFIQKRMKYLTEKMNLKRNLVLPKFNNLEKRNIKKFDHKIKLIINKESSNEKDKDKINTQVSNDKLKINNITPIPDCKNDNVDGYSKCYNKEELNNGCNMKTVSTSLGNSDIKTESNYETQRSLILMSTHCLSDDNDLVNQVKTIKSFDTLQSVKMSQRYEENVCIEVEDVEGKVKGFGDTFKEVVMNDDDNEEMKKFLELKNDLKKSIGYKAVKKVYDSSIMGDINQKEKCKNEIQLKCINEHKTKNEIATILSKIDTLYAIGEPI